jgi:hypothetical protein
VSKTIFSSNQMRKGDDLLGSVVILVNCNEKKICFWILFVPLILLWLGFSFPVCPDLVLIVISG